MALTISGDSSSDVLPVLVHECLLLVAHAPWPLAALLVCCNPATVLNCCPATGVACRYKQQLDLVVQQKQHERWERLYIDRVQYKKLTTVGVSAAGNTVQFDLTFASQTNLFVPSFE